MAHLTNIWNNSTSISGFSKGIKWAIIFITLYQNWSPILRMHSPPPNTCLNKFMMAMMPHLAIPNFFFFINFSFPVSWWFWYWINTWIQVYRYLTLNNRYNEICKKLLKKINFPFAVMKGRSWLAFHLYYSWD